ncbi:hypothetical protein N431DRAFT_439718 [Stipitochalara longipes BDJ]|nr:hypothetical protein N431DRAFT_439718 [Stipitochalara longipes BDJ]
MSAPYYTEKDMERHIKVGGDAVDFKIAQLREIIQQKDLLIKSKDELLEVKEEALRASKELLAQKDKIIKIREGEIQDANTTINSREQTIAEKDEIIRNREENLQQAQITITAHERTIEQKTEAVKNAKQPRKEVYVQLTKKDKAIERQKAHIERQEGALRVKGIKNKELEQRRVDEVATLKTKLAEKDDKIQALEKMLEKGRFASLSPIPKTEPREADPSRSYILKIEAASNTRDDGSEDEEILSRSTNVKAEPMDY